MKLGLCTIKEIRLEKPSIQDNRADFERLTSGLGFQEISLSSELLKKLPGLLRERDFLLKPVVFQLGKRRGIIELYTESCFGLAIDVGTTNLVATLYDFVEKRKILTMNIKNPQVGISEDILGRIHYAMLNGVAMLQEMLVEGINCLIKNICNTVRIKPHNIYCATISANTVMTHFLMGLDVSYVPVEPYTPVIHSPGVVSARDCGVHINREGLLYIFPNAGSYVGGDIISGIVATEIHKSEGLSILIDVGTNAEVVIANKDWILVGAGAAGPALEGGILRSGMVAEEGAIFQVDIDERDKSIHYKTINDAPPRGICGSGVIDLVAELYRAGIIDQRGKIKENPPYLRERNGESFISVHNSIGITEREIENFLRSKAAMFTSLYVLVSSLGLGFADIDRIYIAGALGSGVRVEKAQLIGMLPHIEKERFVAVGNSALKGAEMLLADSSLFSDIEDIQARITYHEMNRDRDFMRHFPSALIIPHGDIDMLR